MPSREPTLIVTGASRVWRRRLGVVAWAALEELALAARRVPAGWVAPVGVRGVAAEIGVNKDTAARAVALLGAAGLLSLQRVAGDDGRRRSGYRLTPPPGVEMRDCPAHQDSQRAPGRRPKNADASGCPADRDSASITDAEQTSAASRSAGARRRAGSPVVAAAAGGTQVSLFELGASADGEGTR
jgi:hypothetical protein